MLPRMPLPNRVTPLGELVAHPARAALVFGNRGCLHDDHGRIRRSHAGRRWIACRLRFKGRRRELLSPGRYTELFFLDDATALAAGHRPCAECRRADFNAFTELWPGPSGGAEALDAGLDAERLTASGTQRHHEAPPDELPDGAFVLRDDHAWLVRGEQLLRWTPAGYAEAVARPAGSSATVITPLSTVAALRACWRPALVPFLHPSATGPHRAPAG
jgi:hypothetical protein